MLHHHLSRNHPMRNTLQDNPVYCVAGDGSVAFDPATAEIKSVVDDDTNHRLIFTDHDLIKESAEHYASAVPLFFSLWAGQLYVWPVGFEDRTITVSGYRKPDDTWLTDPSLEVDLDVRLHFPLIHYAVALAYAQQEDPELEQQYLRRWQIQVGEFKDDILKPGLYSPVVLNGGLDQY